VKSKIAIPEEEQTVSPLIMKKTFPLFIFLLFITVACQKEISFEGGATAYIQIRFHPTINGEPLQLNVPYSNSFGEDFSVSTLKFYAGQIGLVNTSTGSPEMASGDPYFLVDYEKTGSLEIKVPVQPGTYNELFFQLGIDSARNVSGVQSGALDPLQGMFWTWNTGYIFLKMEGNSTQSVEPDGKLEYHIGGFRSPYSAIREYRAILAAPDLWQLENGKVISFDVNYEVDGLFNKSYQLRISDTPVCMTPGELSFNIANNFAESFEVTNYEIH
jgi:hypothetical protein